ncbi:hypothetical protein L6164_029633 [Bauhinia variegata]|uniref:Uncharacterized protein n=1 Tax=Bauhinia variegata TaxID=167791 RepID=A0ACB9LA96_BAUVA|nr:hypothetical protein L6164_029633 [Bauhinia variegata]
MANAGALSGSYSFSDDSSFFNACFSRLANCFDSLHGVKPEMSATAGSGAETRMEESASAAEKAWSGDALELFSGSEAEQTIVVGFGFGVNWEPNLGFKVGLDRFAGIVRDIFVANEKRKGNREGGGGRVERRFLDSEEEILVVESG